MVGAATALVEDFAERLRDRTETGLRKNVRTLAVLGCRLGADKPFGERDSYDLAQPDGHLATEPVCRILRARGRLVDDPDLHRDRDPVRIDRVLAELPPHLAEKVRAWAGVLRTQGPRHDEPRSWNGIRRYPTRLRPVPTAWTQAGTTGLREATTDHLQDTLDALDALRGDRPGAGSPSRCATCSGCSSMSVRSSATWPAAFRWRSDGHSATGPLRRTGRPEIHPLPGRRPVHLPPPAPAHQRQPHLLVTQ
ncbi:hypothetical protein ACFVUN_00305 [Kitasatospora griseola]|uniref:hypothetical protein n=1 Tax=Kitasatospora griseola TaxID=2064 RepID=UPI0036D9AC37